ncbi:MAG: hypothetical protein E6K59_07165 [Nitrospirae bacterium]|nr:MAG: hypothetical protein E6K59_07165 [Nitrospirota bacterium]
MAVLPQLLRSCSPSWGLAAVLLLVTGCVSSQLVPTDMEPQIARDLSFEALKAESEKFRGRVVVLGGKVLSAKRLKEATQIEVLQLPLDKADAPIMTLPQSKGRFLAYQEGFLDPATLPAGTAVSMIAEIMGAKTLPLDEAEYTYPTVKIRTLKIWPQERYASPWPYPYYPYFYRYPYRPFSPYWWDPWY